MIQLQINDVGVVILEPENVRRLQAGHPIRIQLEHFKNLRVLGIDFTNDPVWLADEIKKLMDSGGDPATIPDLVKQSAERPEPPLRPKHDPIFVLGPNKAGSA